MFSLPLLAEEVIRGVVYYDLPEFFTRAGDSNAYRTEGAHTYLAADNNDQHHRQLSVAVRAVGFAIDSDGRITYRRIDSRDFHEEMKKTFGGGRRNATAVREVQLAGRNAFVISYEAPLADGGKDAALMIEIYWIPIHGNRVVELLLAATSINNINRIRDSLGSIVIHDDISLVTASEPAHDHRPSEISVADLGAIANSGYRGPVLVKGRYHFEPEGDCLYGTSDGWITLSLEDIVQREKIDSWMARQRYMAPYDGKIVVVRGDLRREPIRVGGPQPLSPEVWSFIRVAEVTLNKTSEPTSMSVTRMALR